MNWLRLHSEARSDKKLATLTDAQHRVWFNLLCYASEQKVRGTFVNDDPEILAIEVASGDTDLLTATLDRLVRLRILAVTEDEYEFVNWTKRQYDKPSDTPEAVNTRVTRYREAKRNAPVTPDESPETRCNAQKRDVTPHRQTIDRTETDTEQRQTTTDSGREEKSSEVRPVGQSVPGQPKRNGSGPETKADRERFITATLEKNPDWREEFTERVTDACPEDPTRYGAGILRNWLKGDGTPEAKGRDSPSSSLSQYTPEEIKAAVDMADRNRKRRPTTSRPGNSTWH